MIGGIYRWEIYNNIGVFSTVILGMDFR